MSITRLALRDRLLVLSSVLGLLASICPASGATIWVSGGTSTGIADNTTNTNVGIGISNPTAKLQVVGDLYVSQPSGSALIRAYGPTTGFEFTDQTSYIYLRPYHAGVGDMPLQIGPGAGGVRIDTAGKVGIGTTSPSRLLSLYAQYPELILKSSASSEGTGGSTLYFGNASSDSAGWLNYNHTDNSLAVRVNEAERLRINASGNVGIGTTSPAGKLEVGSPGATKLIIATYATDNNEPGLEFWSNYSSSAERNWRIGTSDTAVGDFVVKQSNSSGTSPESNGTVRLIINPAGNVGIGTTTPGTYKLAVEGAIRARSVVVDSATWPDYVFEDSYQLSALSDVEHFIKEKKHLPGIPSAAEVEAGGVSLGDMQARLLAKLEELTLHVIRLDKENAVLRHEVETLKGGR